MIDISNLPDKAPEYDLRDLLEAGMHFGHASAKWHPKMKEYIHMEKDGVHIFDLAKTARQLRVAYNYLYSLGQAGKKVIFVGTKRQARDLLKEAAQKAEAFFVAQRWMGGMLTNWDQISKSIRKMNDIEEGLASGRFDGYTKFERVQLEKQHGRLERFFEGVKGLKGKPDCLVVIDPKREEITVTEAEMVEVPVIALVDSDTDPGSVNIVIPGNDDAVNSVSLVLKELTGAYAAGKKAAK
ncbi:MAG: 30S ribosomal protein S2 [Candidatus Pacebacteria bacterium GW2011_GWB1_47_8]|nr:MAG: 30S ribosomal protein S2 [Candidatus Pacebacteria bacterium GW2011_GWA1_46_10]KKU84723.1 MAG: 30S ribosomal protein S2 [Candidatus Pacebacteria bacterium GW2011_GWB1_47_8]HCR81034.1 30S ribosomal protein S2 [Candidatus Paceibacterota bacterium]